MSIIRDIFGQLVVIAREKCRNTTLTPDEINKKVEEFEKTFSDSAPGSTMETFVCFINTVVMDGIISTEDADELISTAKEYDEELRAIEDECVAEGYPARGSNYELRAEQPAKSYSEYIDSILGKYFDFSEEEDEED